MSLLTIDTSGSICAVGVSEMHSGKVLSEICEEIGRGHAERLMDDIIMCLSQAGMSFGDLEKIAVVRGPGSFTGIRVGMAAANGLASALDLPRVGISMLDALAHVAKVKGGTGPVAVLLDAKRGQAYCQIEDDPPFLAAFDVLEEQLTGYDGVLCGSGCAHLSPEIREKHRVVHALSRAPIETISGLGALMQPGGEVPTPLYLRGTDAKIQSGFALRKREA